MTSSAEYRESHVKGRMSLLCKNFDKYLQYFDKANLSPRAQWQLAPHQRTIARLQELGNAVAAAQDEVFLKSLYDTLEAWGMNQRGAKLVPFPKFRTSLSETVSHLESVEQCVIDSLHPDKADIVARQLWEIIDALLVSETGSKLVAGTKTLHHLLPNVILPIDRENIAAFFGWEGPRLQYGQREAFFDMFRRLCELAYVVHPANYVGTGQSGWNTSRTKVLDNAIVGCMLFHTREALQT